MPPRRYSRHTFTRQVSKQGTNLVYLTDRTKFLYQPFIDNISHAVKQGDTLQSLASRYYSALSDPPSFSAASLWWVIADFQPQPIHDPTIQLSPGSVLAIPALRTVTDRIFNPNSRISGGGYR